MNVSVLPAASVLMVERMPIGSKSASSAKAPTGCPVASSRTASRVWMAALLYTHWVPGSCCWSRAIENPVLSSAPSAICT